MDHIGGLLQKVLHKRGLEKHASASLVVHHGQQWIQLHLPELAECLVATTYKEGVLTIYALHSIAAQAFQEKKEDCMAYLKEECDHPTLGDIRILRQ